MRAVLVSFNDKHKGRCQQMARTRTRTKHSPLSPSDFQLIDANGARVFPLAASSDVYTGNVGVAWASRYATNQFVQNHLVFDVSPTAKDLLLLIKEANVEVRLPDR